MPAKYRYMYRRFILMVPTAILALTLIFFLMDVVPGDTARIILGQEGSPESLAKLRAELGLDKPVYERYVTWLARLLTGDLGQSLRSRENINQTIGDRLPVTATLAISSIVVAMLIGIPSGIISAIKANTRTDFFVSMGAFVGISMPGFWLGLMMIILFSIILRILPTGGFVSTLVDPVEGIKRLMMPSLMLGATLAAFLARITRAVMLEVLLQEYITTARSKGLSERIVTYRHALRNAMIPVVTVLGFQFGGLMGGTILAETIFTIPGMGLLMYDAVLQRDYQMVQGVAVVSTFIFIIVNLVVDSLYLYLDPRVRYG